MNDQDAAYEELAARHGFGQSERYRRLLQHLMSPVQARLVSLLPASSRELTHKTGLDAGDLERHLKELARIGVLVIRDISGSERHCFSESVDQLHDTTLTSRLPDKAQAQQLFAHWNQFCHEEWYPQIAQQFATTEFQRERVIPAYQAIKHLSGVLPHEDVREIVKSNHPIATLPCTCRRREQTCDGPLDVCIQFGAAAELAVRRGVGKLLSKEEAMEVMDRAEEAGLVHGWINTDTVHSTCMCNCCSDCCIAMVPLIEHDVPLGIRVARSRFDAVVDQDLCIACEVCVDRCPFGAIEMKALPGSADTAAEVDVEQCFGCGACVLTCDTEALSLVLVRPEEHIPKGAPA